MKLMRRNNSHKDIDIAEEKSDKIPKAVVEFDEMSEKPPGKCILDVTALHMGSEGRSRSRSRGRGNNSQERSQTSQRDGKENSSSKTNRISRNNLPVEPSPTEEETLFGIEIESREDKQKMVASDIYRALAETSSTRQGSRKNKKSIAPMPTLNEAHTEEDEITVVGGQEEQQEEQSSYDSWDESNMSFETEIHQNLSEPQSPKVSKTEKQAAQSPKNKPQPNPIQPTVTQLLCMDEHKKACEKIRKYMGEATSMAAEGREEESIQAYKKALQLGRSDVRRIKAHLKKQGNLTDRFYQDWLEIGVVLSDIRTCQAHLHERLLDYDHAISCVQEAISIYRRQITFFKSRSKEKAATLTKVIANLEAVIARVKNAKKHDAKRKQAHENILQFQMKAGSATFAEERVQAYKQMESAAQNLRVLEVKYMGDWHPLVADASSLLGAIALEQGNIDVALSSMKEALAIMKKALGMKHPRTGTKLLNIASVYANQGQDLLAVDHYNMAVAVFRSCNSNKLVASTLNDVAVIHIRRKEFERSISLLHESLEAYKGVENPWETAQVWRNLGESYCQQKEFGNGATAFMGALNIQRDGRSVFDMAVSSRENGLQPENTPPLHLVDDASIADTLRRLGKAYFCARKFENALAYYKEACIIHKSEVKKVVHVTKSKSSTSLPARQDDLAQTIYCMAELYEQSGELDQAMRLFSESLQLRLFSDAHKEFRSNMVHCAMCLYGMGGVHLKQHEYEESLAVTEQAVSYCEAHGIPSSNVIYVMIKNREDEAKNKLAEEKSIEQALAEEKATEESKEDAVPSLEEIDALELDASDAVKEGNLVEAVKMLTNVMQKRKVLLHSKKALGDDSTSLKYETACTLYTFGKVLEMQANYKNAEKAYKDSLKLFKKSGTQPDEDVLLRLCAALQNILKRQR